MINHRHYHIKIPFIKIFDLNSHDNDIYMVNCDPNNFIFNIMDQLKEPDFNFIDNDCKHLDLCSIFTKFMRASYKVEDRDGSFYWLNGFFDKAKKSLLSKKMIDELILSDYSPRQYVATFECKLHIDEDEYNDEILPSFESIKWNIYLINIEEIWGSINNYPQLIPFGYNFKGINNLCNQIRINVNYKE